MDPEVLKLAWLSNFPWRLLGRFPGLPQTLEDSGLNEEDNRGSLLSVEGELIDGLTKRDDIDLHVMTFSRNVQAPRRHEGERLTLHVLPGRRGTGMISGWVPRSRLLNAYLPREVRPHVVYGARMIGGYAAMAVRSGYPSVIMLQEFFRGAKVPFVVRLGLTMGIAVERQTLKKATDLVAISDHVQRYVDGATSARIHKIPNPVGDRYFSIERVEPDVPTCIFLGRLVPEKGLMDLLRAAVLLHERGVKARWVIVGDAGIQGKAVILRRKQSELRTSSFVDECKEFAAKSLPPDSYHFQGWADQETVAGLLGSATCAAFPSTASYETFNVALGEARAAACPPVVYRYGPLPEQVTDGVSGSVVDPGDIEALADRLQILLEDRAVADRMGVAARQSARSSGIEEVVAAHVRACRDALAGAGK